MKTAHLVPSPFTLSKSGVRKDRHVIDMYIFCMLELTRTTLVQSIVRRSPLLEGTKVSTLSIL